MKVLYVNAVCGVGSTGRIVADLMTFLREKGHEAKVAFGVGNAVGVPDGDAVKIGGRANYYLHNAISRLTDHAGLYSARATRRLIEFAVEYDPDVYHLHNLHGYYVNYEMLFEHLAKVGKPVVMTLHDCWNFTGHCTHFCQIGCDQWKARCKDCRLLHRYPACFLSGDVGANFDRKKKAFAGVKNMVVVTPSSWLASFAKESFLGGRSIEVIPNGIDVGVFKPTDSRFRETHCIGRDTMVLGVSNVWNRAKGFQDFLALSKMLGKGYKVVLVGLSENQLRDLPEEVIGIARTESARELAKLYSAADLFVNLTREDTSSMVNLEAQACGTPVVTYDTGGCPETVVPGFGITVPCGDLISAEKAIRGLGRTVSAPERGELVDSMDRRLSHERYLSLYERVLTESDWSCNGDGGC